MKKIRRIISLVLAVLLVCSTTLSASAKKCRFSDVADTHWAAEHIETLADGGIINGYGNGKFGPNDAMKIDEVATIICNAKGHSVETTSGYWGYEAVRYCRDELRCLPDQGDITKANYGKTCTRELAVYMLVKALGTKNAELANGKLTEENIPDYAEIDKAYAKTVLEAYKLGMVIGTNDAGTFGPKGNFTRAQICTILTRTGHTVAAEKPDDTAGTGMTGEELYAEVKSWGGWREFDGGNWKTLTATDPLHGGVEVKINKNGVITITMPEENQDAWLKNGNFVDAYGNVVPQSVLQNGYCNEDGKFVMSSGWSYEARQLVKKVLALAYPASTDEAYGAMLAVMKQEIYEIPSEALPSAGRWVDGRGLRISLDQASHSACVAVTPIGEVSYYDTMMAGASVGRQATYNPAHMGAPQMNAMYELARG